jgi:hypothetical protein
MSKYKKKKKRTGLGTGQACMGLNIKYQKDCPFMSLDQNEDSICNVNEFEECDIKHCKLKEFGRIIVDWIE